MKSFDATVVVPTNFVLFTISAIISGKFEIRSCALQMIKIGSEIVKPTHCNTLHCLTIEPC